MEFDALPWAIPLFVGLVGAEALLEGRYKLTETFANLGCGALQQAGLALAGGSLAAGYSWVQAHALIHWPAGGRGFALALLGIDVIYYAWHRLSHRWRPLWAAHSVHHQSEQFNLSVGLRQGFFADLTGWPFYALLALAGVPLEVFAVAKAVHMVWAFFSHAQSFPKLGPLEWVFVTPSHHRLHHARNGVYVDSNYGGILIVWDRLFGSFRAESEKPRYGVTPAFLSFDPVVAHFAPWLAPRKVWKLRAPTRPWVLAVGGALAIAIVLALGTIGMPVVGASAVFLLVGVTARLAR